MAIARITNTFGGNDPHVAHVVTGSILAALKGEAPVIRQSGKDSKGFLYVDDAVFGILTLAEKTAVNADLYGEAFNLSPDESICVADLIREICSVAGCDSDLAILKPSARFETEH